MYVHIKELWPNLAPDLICKKPAFTDSHTPENRNIAGLPADSLMDLGLLPSSLETRVSLAVAGELGAGTGAPRLPHVPGGRHIPGRG